jgi:hypothetical protein
MPEIELKPDDYRVRARSGRWMNRDDWRITMPYAAIVAVGFIVFAWWHRDELSLAILFGATIVPSLLLGVAIGAWLKRFD